MVSRETKRQLVHLCFMLTLWGVFRLVSLKIFIGFCVFLLLYGWFIVYTDNGFARWLLKHLERPGIRRLAPGKGAFTIVFGVLITALLFPAVLGPAILVLGISDSLATLFGVAYGKRKVPGFPTKTWIGTSVFFVSCAAILFFHSPWWPLVALLVTLAELVDYQKHPFLDDNVVLPVLTGLLLTLI